jgi:hypothetical protein
MTDGILDEVSGSADQDARMKCGKLYVLEALNDGFVC